jgi:hypothetical protein
MTQGSKTVSAITDAQGAYAFPDLAEGTWALQVEMPGFSPIRQDIGIIKDAPSPEWELKMLPLGQIQSVAAPAPSSQAAPPNPQTVSINGNPPAASTEKASATPADAPTTKRNSKKSAPVGPTNTKAAFQRADLNAAAPAGNSNSEAAAPGGDASTSQAPSELSARAADGLLINGSQNNGASSQFAINPAFGNGRRGPRSLYNGNVGVIVDNSALDARTFSYTGQDTAKPGYSRFQGVAAFGGPIKIPGLVKRNGPNFFVNYQWLRNRNAPKKRELPGTTRTR